MKVKKKLTSILSLVLALCMLLSTVAFALDTGSGADSTGAADSSYTESAPTEETEQTTDADSSVDADTSVNEGEPTGSDVTDPTEPTTPTVSPVEGEGTEEEPSPDTMEANTGWAVTGDGTYTYTYWEDDTEKVAGAEDTYSVLYLSEPEQTNTGVTMAAGYYYFQDGVWANNYSDSTHTRYKNIGVVQPKDGKHQVTSTYDRRMLTVENGVGKPYTGFELGTESTPNLYYYYEGDFQTAKSKEELSKNDGYHTFDNKLYYASETTLSKTQGGKPWPYAVPFTGRRTENGNKRRYEKGVPYNSYGLGTEKTPKLYYYVDGYYKTETSKEKLSGFHTYNNKCYYGSSDSLKNYNAPLANNMYRTISGKLYKYTNGSASLYTGVYKNYYYSKGVKQSKSGWVKVSGKWYYFKSSKAVTGWQYLSRNSKTYKYYFKSDGVLVEDLFTYFGKSYLSKKMLIQVNRTTHTADILLYDSKKKSYCIAASSFVCSTCKKSSDFKTGTFSLYSNRRRRWFTFTNPDTKKTTYYQYATFIVGTHSWIHSPQYKKKGDIYSLNPKNYNGLGSNQSFYCVRFQTIYSKRVYDAVGKQGSKKVKVKLYNSSNKGPYGQIKLADSTGKLSKKTTYDPTDPAVKK